MSYRHDIGNLYNSVILQENVTGGGAAPLPSAPPIAQKPASQPPVQKPYFPVPATSQQEQMPVKNETVNFDFIFDGRRAAFFAHLVYNAVHKVAKSFDLVNAFVDELVRIHRREKRNYQLKQMAKLR